MKKQKLFYGIFLIIGCLFALASCDWFTEEEGEDRIDVKGQLTVYVGSTARPLYAITAPSYADFDYVHMNVKSYNKKGVEAYFTDSCADDEDGWSEFVIEGIKKGTYKVELSVEEFELSKVFEVKVVDKDSLSFEKTDLKLVRGTSEPLEVINNMNLPLIYSSTNEDVAKVSKDGRVTAVKSGLAQIIVESEDGILTSSCNVTVVSDVVAPPYFWGEWISMYDGSHLKIQEKDVTYSGYDENGDEIKAELEIKDKTDETITIISKAGNTVDDKKLSNVLGEFKKSSSSVMILDYDENQSDGKNIPFFRNGGQDLKYTLQLVGFTKEVAESSRAVSTLNLNGLKVKGQSNTYTSYEQAEQTSDQDGKVTLTAPVAGDVQTVTVTSNEGAVIVVPDLKIETDGVAMGKIPVVNKGDYSLKVTGTPVGDLVDEDDGYLYQGMDKSYEMEICITNISEVKSGAGHISITSADEDHLIVSPASSTSEDIKNLVIPTLKPGASKRIKVEISYTGTSSTPYVDTALNISITNAKTSVSPERTWDDVVPVRFFQKKVPIYIRPQLLDDDDGDEDAQLHVFVMYPDGSCMYDYLEDREPGCLEVPSFGSEKPYYLAFCGATSDSVRGSSEMWYTVNLEGKEISEDVIHERMAVDTAGDMGYGEELGKDEEVLKNLDAAYEVTGTKFQATVGDGDIDFWKFYIK